MRCLSRPPQNLPVARSGAGTPNGPLFAATGSAAVGTQGVWQRVEVSASRAGAGLNAGTVTTGREGWLWLPPAQEPLAHDADGNLTGSARWTLQWDAENRLAVAEEKDIARPPGAPARVRLEMAYDSQSRRVRKVVKQWNPSSGSFELFSDTRFVYDGWNLIAELRMNQESGILDLESTHAWGLDLSGTMTGAGGVGGLLLTALHSTTQTTANNGQPQPTSVLAPCYDGNGNILAYLDCATGQLAARYEYDPFGQLTAKDEAPAVAGRLHHQFSTKYADAETGFVYYGFRYYSPELGRWPSRDPIGEEGGINLSGMCGNDVVNKIDYLGEEQLSLTYDLSGDSGFGHWLHVGLWADGSFKSFSEAYAAAAKRVGSFHPEGTGSCNCIKSLVFVTHGVPGSIDCPCSTEAISAVQPTKHQHQFFQSQPGMQALMKFDSLMCKQSEMRFTACKSNDDGGDLKNQMDKAINSNVRLNTNIGGMFFGCPCERKGKKLGLQGVKSFK